MRCFLLGTTPLLAMPKNLVHKELNLASHPGCGAVFQDVLGGGWMIWCRLLWPSSSKNDSQQDSRSLTPMLGSATRRTARALDCAITTVDSQTLAHYRRTNIWWMIGIVLWTCFSHPQVWGKKSKPFAVKNAFLYLMLFRKSSYTRTHCCKHEPGLNSKMNKHIVSKLQL